MLYNSSLIQDHDLHKYINIDPDNVDLIVKDTPFQ